MLRQRKTSEHTERPCEVVVSHGPSYVLVYGLEAVRKLLFSFDVNHTVRGNVHGALGVAGNEEVTHEYKSRYQQR